MLEKDNLKKAIAAVKVKEFIPKKDKNIVIDESVSKEQANNDGPSPSDFSTELFAQEILKSDIKVSFLKIFFKCSSFFSKRKKKLFFADVEPNRKSIQVRNGPTFNPNGDFEMSNVRHSNSGQLDFAQGGQKTMYLPLASG